MTNNCNKNLIICMYILIAIYEREAIGIPLGSLKYKYQKYLHRLKPRTENSSSRYLRFSMEARKLVLTCTMEFTEGN